MRNRTVILLLALTPLSLPDEIHGYEDEIDAELQTSRPKLRGVYAAYANQGTEQRGVSVKVKILYCVLGLISCLR